MEYCSDFQNILLIREFKVGVWMLNNSSMLVEAYCILRNTRQ